MHNITQILSPQLYNVLQQIVAIAQTRNIIVWPVGGIVRDMLRGISDVRDLDLAIEGDVLALAHTLADALDGRVSASHQAFGTATVELPAGSHSSERLSLDLARTRTEHYPHPAALPVVQPASIEQDLARRDFSINAMALEVQLAAEKLVFMRLLDPFNGQRDLDMHVLRVLHNNSFIDDPTRMLRGLRLAARLNIPFEAHTQALLAEALDASMLEATSADRIRTDLCLALEEPDPWHVLQRANELSITPHIFAPLQHAARKPAANMQPPQEPLIRAGLLTYELSMEERETYIKRYRLPNEGATVLRDVSKLRTLLDTLTRPDLPNSAIDSLLRFASDTALRVVTYAESGRVGDAITHYRTTLRATTPHLNGHALQQLGIAPGPQIGALLAGLRAARLDGLVSTQEDEEAWVRQQSQQQPPEE
jgi:tRNA nucleotidyltransferase (CCA-adding enzyme)